VPKHFGQSKKRDDSRWEKAIERPTKEIKAPQVWKTTNKTKHAKVGSKTSSGRKNTFSIKVGIRKLGKLCPTVEKKYLCRKTLTPLLWQEF
jgi:hypothetical protein